VTRLTASIFVLLAAPAVAQQLPVTITATGNCGNGNSQLTSITGDGRYALLHSSATNLALSPAGNSATTLLFDLNTRTLRSVGPRESDYSLDASLLYFYYESSPQFRRRVIATGVETNIATNAAGEAINGSLYEAKVSANGQWLLFATSANNMVANDTNNVQDVFLKNLQTGAIRRVSQPFAGGQFTVASYLEAISDDGSRFVLYSRNNPQSGTTYTDYTCLVIDANTPAVLAVRACSEATFSSDSQKVLFNHDGDGYLYDLASGTEQRVTLNNGGTPDGSASGPSMSPDAKWVCWQTTAVLPGFTDTNNVSDVYYRDLTAGVTYRASLNNDGFEGNAASINCAISNGGAVVGYQSASSSFACTESLSSNTVDVFLLDRRRIFANGFQTP
jgi:hypothetical protein